MASQNTDGNLDVEKLKSFRKETMISGHYLRVWDVFVKHASDEGYRMNLDDYIVTFDENDENYLIYFKKPTTTNMLGGGNGSCLINKQTMNVVDCKFAR